PTRRRARDRPSDHIVDRRRLADVLDVVLLIRGLKDDSAGADAARRPILKRLERSLLDDEQLFVLMLMRRVRRLTGIERGNMNLELVERRRRGSHDLAHRTPGI